MREKIRRKNERRVWQNGQKKVGRKKNLKYSTEGENVREKKKNVI